MVMILWEWMDGKWKVRPRTQKNRQRNTGNYRNRPDHGVLLTDRPAHRPSMEAAGRGWFGSPSHDPPLAGRRPFYGLQSTSD